VGKYDDKTEAPTQKRKRESRRDGQVARSPDLVSWFLLLVATSLLPGLVSRVAVDLRELLANAAVVASHPEPTALPGLVGKALLVLVTGVGPTLVACMGLAIVGNLAQVGFIFTGKPLRPRLSNLNPAEGLKRMFSAKALWQLGAEAMRLGVILAVVSTMIHGVATDLANASMRSPGDVVGQLATTSLGLVRTVAAVCVLIGIADYAVKRRDLMRKLRMSKQEIKQEYKDSEGDPHVRARMRSMRMSMTRNRMLNAIAGADVVITNPTHLAIAISYSREKGAPRVVARGAGSLAEKIRAEADRHDVPRVEAKPLARTLYRLCRPGEEIPAELYQAVATVLAFLHRLGETHRSYRGRLHLDVADSWTPTDGTELKRVPPQARARARRQAEAAARASVPTVRVS
jgi:flagellar biosynthetic protein FlhB